MTTTSPALRALLHDLQSLDRARIRTAENQLLALGEQAVEPLCQWLSLPEPLLQGRIAQLLSRLQARAALPFLKQAFLANSNQSREDSRGLLFRAIADLVPAGANEWVAFFSAHLLSDQDLFVRAAAADALAKISDQSARGSLLRAKQDAETWVREAAARALAALDARNALEVAAAIQGQPQVENDTESQNLGRNLANSTEADREYALNALLARGFRALPVLLSLLGDPRQAIRLAAYRGIGRLRDRRALQPLVTRIEDASLSLEERALAIRALAALLDGRDVELVPMLSRTIRADDRFVRAASVAGLVRIGTPQARALVLQALDDADSYVKEQVARSLAAHGSSAWGADAVPRIARALQLSSAPEIVSPLLRALGAVEPAPPLSTGVAWGAAKDKLRHSHPAIRAAALTVAIDHAPANHPEYLAALPLLLRDEVRDIRVSALRCLQGKQLAKSLQNVVPALRAFLLEERSLAMESMTLLAEIADRASVEALIAARHERDPEIAAHALRLLSSLDPEGTVRVQIDTSGNLQAQNILRCQSCRSELQWQSEGYEKLACPSCQREHVLAHGERPVAVASAAYGICACRGCQRRQLLVWEGDKLQCPQSRERYLRPQDPMQPPILVRELQFGPCTCCGRDSKPLIKNLSGAIVCPRTEREHTLRDGCYVLLGNSAASDVDAINRALLAGTLNLTQSGLPSNEDPL